MARGLGDTVERSEILGEGYCNNIKVYCEIFLWCSCHTIMLLQAFTLPFRRFLTSCTLLLDLLDTMQHDRLTAACPIKAPNIDMHAQVTHPTVKVPNP